MTWMLLRIMVLYKKQPSTLTLMTIAVTLSEPMHFVMQDDEDAAIRAHVIQADMLR